MTKRSPKRTDERKAAGTPRGNAPPRTGSPVLFRVLAILLPFLVLAAAEMVLRFRGHGGYPPILVKALDEGNGAWYATNRRGTDTFFMTGGTQTGGMRELQFFSPKPPNTVRVVLIGESAIQGFPETLPLTDGSFLEAMLRGVWNDGRSVEVLNLGATAVASFPAVEILKASLVHQPDLAVLMVGNNEYYGAYGVVATPAWARSPLGLTLVRGLRSLAVVQWLTSLRPSGAVPSGTLMERMARNAEIGPDDPMRRAATSTLSASLEKAVRLCREARVPLIVCTVPTNERSLAPIGREPAAAADGSRVHFLRADSLERAGQEDEALAEYVKAKDRDTMPWRATSAAEEAARASVAHARDPRVILCDLESAFRSKSPGGAVGWELMNDHVHMTVAGQALFARTVVESMTRLDGPVHVDAARLAALPPDSVYAERLGHSPYSDLYALRNLKAIFDIPFMKQNNPEAHERFVARERALLDSLSVSDRAAVDRWRNAGGQGATDRPLEFVVGLDRLASGHYADAARLFGIARASVPPLSLWRLEIAWHLLLADRHLHDAPTPEDVALLRECLHVGVLLSRQGGGENARVQRYLGLAYNLAGDPRSAIPALETARKGASESGERWEVVQSLADCYLQLNRKTDARRILEDAARDPATGGEATKRLQEIGP